MYQYPFQLNSKKILIKPYTTETEKDLLIMSSFEIYDMDEILRVLGLEENLIKELTVNEKKVLLYKYREISIGDEITMKFKCSHCKQTNEGIIECKIFIENEEINHKYKQLDEIPNDENLHLFVSMTKEELENLDLDEYENLLKDVENSQIKYNFTIDIYGNLSFSKLKDMLPILVITGDLPKAKGDKKNVLTTFTHPLYPQLNFEDTGKIDVQGTSSQWSKLATVLRNQYEKILV